MQGDLRVRRHHPPPLEIVFFELGVDRIAQLPAADHRHMVRQTSHSTVFRLAASGRPRATASASEIRLPRRDSDAVGRENNAARKVGMGPCTSFARQILPVA